MIESQQAAIIKIVCGRQHSVPKVWTIPEKEWENTCERCRVRFVWKLKKKGKRGVWTMQG